MEATEIELDRLIARFAAHDATLNPPTNEINIAQAEARLGVRFPSSYRNFVLRHNGLTHNGSPGFEVFGVPAPGASYPHDGMFNYTESARGNLGFRLDDDINAGTATEDEIRERHALDNAFAIYGGDGSGDSAYLLCDETGADGEVPVGLVDHETDTIIACVASTFPTFLWFLLDRAERNEALERDPNAPGDFPWPHDDPRWIVEQDPKLTRWYSEVSASA